MTKRFSPYRSLNRFNHRERKVNSTIILEPKRQEELKGIYRGIIQHLTGSDKQAVAALGDYDRLQDMVLPMAGLHKVDFLTPYFAALLARPLDRLSRSAHTHSVHLVGRGVQEYPTTDASGAVCTLHAPKALAARFATLSKAYLTTVREIEVSPAAADALVTAAWYPGQREPGITYSNGPLRPSDDFQGEVMRQQRLRFGDQ